MTEMANRMTVHMDEKPVYDILLEQEFFSSSKGIGILSSGT